MLRPFALLLLTLLAPTAAGQFTGDGAIVQLGLKDGVSINATAAGLHASAQANTTAIAGLEGLDVQARIAAGPLDLAVGIQPADKQPVTVEADPIDEMTTTPSPPSRQPSKAQATETLGWMAAILAGSALLAKLFASGPIGRIVRVLGAIPIIGLFSRIDEGELVKHELRRGALDYLQINPGASMQDIRQHLGVAWGTTVYHLRRLEEARMVVSDRHGRLRRFWLRGSPEAARRHTEAILLETTPQKLAAAIQAEPGLAQNELCQRIGINRPVASKHLRRLEEQQLIKIVPKSRSRLYYPTEQLQAAKTFAAPEIHVTTAEPPSRSEASPVVAPPARARSM